jgi:hypothetical protein
MIVDAPWYVPNAAIRRRIQTPTAKEEIRRYSSPECTPKCPSTEPHGGTRQQAITETPAKWSACQIPRVIVVFVVLVRETHSRKPQEALNPSVTEERYWALFCMAFLYNLLNVTLQIANKMGLQKKKYFLSTFLTGHTARYLFEALCYKSEGRGFGTR